jgi:hypothetical protein
MQAGGVLVIGLIIVGNGIEYGSDQSWCGWIESFYRFASDL